MKPDSPYRDLIIFIVIIVIFFFLWLWIGGPNRPEATGGKFRKPFAPLDTGEVYDVKIFNRNTTTTN